NISDDQPGRARPGRRRRGSKNSQAKRPGCDETLESAEHQKSNSPREESLRSKDRGTPFVRAFYQHPKERSVMEKKTPLYDLHLALGGRMVPFAGFLLPVQYETGVIAEHKAVREASGLFDVSHMGELRI